MLSVVDVDSCCIIQGMIQWSIKRENVVGFFNAPPEDYTMPREIFLRCENGSQFESGIVRAYLKSEGITPGNHRAHHTTAKCAHRVSIQCNCQRRLQECQICFTGQRNACLQQLGSFLQQ